MTMIGDILIPSYKSEVLVNLSDRESFTTAVLNDLFGDNSAVDFYKINAFALSNTCFFEAVKCYLNTQFNGSMIMLRTTIDSALFFTYCYEPTYENGKAKPTSFTPTSRFKVYRQGGRDGNWEWNNGIRDSISCLNLSAILGLKATATEEIQDIRNLGNFSAHLPQKQVETLRKYSEMSDTKRRSIGYRIKWTAEEPETKIAIENTSKYLKHIRERYFTKFPHP